MFAHETIRVPGINPTVTLTGVRIARMVSCANMLLAEC